MRRQLEAESKTTTDSEVQVDGQILKLHYKQVKEVLKIIQRTEKDVLDKLPEVFEKGQAVMK